MLLLHISSALLAILASGTTFARPSVKLIRVSAGLTAITLSSGTWLVLSRPVHILAVCLSGLFFTGYIGLCLAGAKKRLDRSAAL